MSNHLKQIFKIDKQSPVPMYFQIRKEIIKAIKSGVYKVGDRLPTELEFCNELDISRPTIRQAFQELINEGYITRKKAKGTFVCKPKVEGYFFKKLESYNDEMRALQLTPRTEVVTSEVIPAEADIRECLQLPEGASVFHLVRLRFADEEPMVYVHTYIPYDRFLHIEKKDFADNEVSLYDVMKHDYHMSISYVDRTIEASNATLPLADMLDIAEGQAIYTITTLAYDEEDTPLEYSVANYRGDRSKFTIRLVQQ